MTASKKPRSRADIPNQDGFNLSVLLKNGVWKNTTVVWSHGAQMFHLNGVSITDVVTWEPIANIEESQPAPKRKEWMTCGLCHGAEWAEAAKENL